MDVRNPSRHTVHIYVVPDETFQEWFEDLPYGGGAEETMCQGHQCWGVTSGLYLKTSTAASVLYAGIRQTLGFRDPFQEMGLPSPTPLDSG